MEQPRNRALPERLAFNEENIVMKDYMDNYIEFQFEEVRLKDYRAKMFDQELVNMEQTELAASNPLRADNMKHRVVNSPTINTKFAFQELKPFLRGTPKLAQSLGENVNVAEGNDQTANFQILQLALVDAERRNAERGGFDDTV